MSLQGMGRECRLACKPTSCPAPKGGRLRHEQAIFAASSSPRPHVVFETTLASLPAWPLLSAPHWKPYESWS